MDATIIYLFDNFVIFFIKLDGLVKFGVITCHCTWVYYFSVTIAICSCRGFASTKQTTHVLTQNRDFVPIRHIFTAL